MSDTPLWMRTPGRWDNFGKDWIPKHLDQFPCGCNPARKASERCTRSGWIRCNERLSATFEWAKANKPPVKEAV